LWAAIFSAAAIIVEKPRNRKTERFVTQPPATTRRLATTLLIGARSGWGVYGCNLALRAAERGVAIVPMGPCYWQDLEPRQRAKLADTEYVYQWFWQEFANRKKAGKGNDVLFDGDVLHCLANDLKGPTLPFSLQGRRKFASVFLENPVLSSSGIEFGKSLDGIIAGSDWNGKILRQHGLTNVVAIPQGINPEIFHPAPSSGEYKDRFVVFSGGKLEYRKGQDLVVLAMREFSRMHPDALLMLAWHNIWPDTMKEIETAGLVHGTPTVENDTPDFAGWLRKNGLNDLVDLGAQRNWQMAPLLREADVALFPNRCEGGTNLVAMETMACGIPTILSANTGHLDIISEETCYPLKQQGPVRPTELYPNTQDWGESSVEEIVENLNRVYADREEARRRGKAAAEAIRKMSWANQIDLIFAEMEKAGKQS
jgi:glycosyltransferase involved in cell wall biosynthesis